MKKFLLLAIILICLSLNPTLADIGYSSIHVLGVVNSNGVNEGFSGELLVEVKEGEGNVFVNTIPLIGVNTQSSVRLAKDVSCDLLNLDCSKFDFFYTIKDFTNRVEGPSAGGAMSLATISAILGVNRSLNSAMTGTINPDGSLGLIGGVVEKVLSTKNLGLDYVFIPITQSKALKNSNKTNNSSINNVIEINNVLEAFKIITKSEEFNLNHSNFNTSTDYLNVFRNMALKLNKRMNESFKEFENEINSLKFSNLEFNKREELKELLRFGFENMNKSLKNFQEQNFYVSASQSLQASINLNYGRNLLKFYFFEEDFVQKLKEDLFNEINFFEKNLKFKLDHIYDLELLITSLDRFKLSKEIFENGEEELNNSKLKEAVFSFTTSKERLETSKAWFEATKVLKGDLNYVFIESSLKNLVNEEIKKAEVLLDYSSNILGNNQNNIRLSEGLNNLKEMLFDNDDFAHHLFQSLLIKSDTELVLSFSGISQNELDSFFESKKLNVLNLINKEIKNGREPLLSISYYYFALEFFKNNDSINGLKYLNYAGTYSSLSKSIFNLLNKNEETEGFSDLVQINNNPNKINFYGFNLFEIRFFLLIFSVIFLIILFGLKEFKILKI